MQRVFYASGLSPDDFWSSTFDEVLLVVKGKVDDWRVLRNHAYFIHASMVERPGDMYSWMPLPYDWELQKEEGEELVNDTELYEQGKIIRIPGLNYGS